MTKTYTQICAELAPLQAKADRLERDLAAFDAWIASVEGQRFLDLREARDDTFYALPISVQESITDQSYEQMVCNKSMKSPREIHLLLIAQCLRDNALDYHYLGNGDLILVRDGGDIWSAYLPEDEISLDQCILVRRII